MAAASIITAVVAAAGSLLSYYGSSQQAKAARQEGVFQRQLADQQAGQELAASQYANQEEQRRAAFLHSRALSLAAASGAGASDPTAVQILSGITAEGAYRGAMELYQGEEKARYLRASGRAQESIGGQRARGYETAAAGELAGNAASWYGKYAAPKEKTKTPGSPDNYIPT